MEGIIFFVGRQTSILWMIHKLVFFFIYGFVLRCHSWVFGKKVDGKADGYSLFFVSKPHKSSKGHFDGDTFRTL